jgi:hypothetical protein
MVNVTAVLDKMQKYKRNWLQHVNRIYRNKLLTVLKKIQTDRQKEGGETIKWTSVCVRPEWV